MRKKIFFIAAIFLILGSIFFYKESFSINDKSEKVFEEQYSWQNDFLIGHAFYGIDNISYTNSLEAFLEGYKQGIRTFEVDFQFTNDQELVLAHDLGSENSCNKDAFLNNLILGKYTPLTFVDLLNLMEKYPDIYIVTDSKYSDYESVSKQFFYMYFLIKNKPSLLKRFIIQIYNEEMYETINKIIPNATYIFTMYMRWNGGNEEFTKICDWCEEKNINNITMWTTLANEEVLKIAKEHHINIYVHTENDLSLAKQYLKQGIKGIYTDFLKPSDF